MDALQTFISESEDHITTINSKLLDIEQDEENTEAMDAVFRASHTLKGNSGAMGFDQMSVLAHRMEDLLDEIRGGDLNPSGDVIDDLFKAVDVFEQMLSEVKEQDEPQTNPDDVITRLETQLESEQSEKTETDSTEIDDEDEITLEELAERDEDQTTEDEVDEESQPLTDVLPEPDPTATGDLLSGTEFSDSEEAVFHIRVLTDETVTKIDIEDELRDTFSLFSSAIADLDEAPSNQDVVDAIITSPIETETVEDALEQKSGVLNSSAFDVTDSAKFDPDGIDRDTLSEDPSVDEVLAATEGMASFNDSEESSVTGVDEDVEKNGAGSDAERELDDASDVFGDDDFDINEDGESESSPTNTGDDMFHELKREAEAGDAEEMSFDEIQEEMDAMELTVDGADDTVSDIDLEDLISGDFVVQSESGSGGSELFGDGLEEDDESDGGTDDRAENNHDADGTETDPGHPDTQDSEDVYTDDAEVNEVLNTVTDIDDFSTMFESGQGLDEFDDLIEESRSSNSGSEIDLDQIRVDVQKLDELYTQVQELITNRIRLRNSVESVLAAAENAETATTDSLSSDLVGQAYSELEDLEHITSRMQGTVMDIRLVPIRHATERLPRIVRDVARDSDKQVQIDIEGEDVELDRAILSQLGDPLMHLVRNAVDHGIESPDERSRKGKPETGTVTVSAKRHRDRVTVQVKDDGGGIDADRIRAEASESDLLTEEQAMQLTDNQAYELMFRPGFTTKDEVTETSGRGVGLDVVYDTVRGLEGSVRIQSEPDIGTVVELRLPVSLAIMDVLFIRVGESQFGIPIKNISEIDTVSDIDMIDGEQVHTYNGKTYPLFRLQTELEMDSETVDDSELRLLRVDDSVRQVALVCDEILDQKEVVVEPYDGILSRIPGLSGAAVLGEGNVVNILDVESL